IMKKILAVILCLAMVGSAFTGCASTPPAASTSPESSASEKTEPVKAESEAKADGSPLFEKTLEFSILCPVWEPHSKATEKMEIFNEIAKRTNTKIDYQWVPQDGYQDRVTTVLASGDIPEVMSLNKGREMMIDQGAIIPLDDYLAKSGGNILSTMEDVLPMVKNPTDGKIYGIPFVLDYKPAYSMLVRKDWMDKVGVTKVPSTWDEWLAMWTKFKDEDPNGDGSTTNDIPYGGDIYSLMPAFGLNITDKNAFLVKDDTYTLAYEVPEFKEYLNAVRGMYEKGLLDGEFATRGTFVNQKEFEKAMFSGVVGSAMTWAEMAKRVTESVKDVKPDAKMIGVAPLTGTTGVGAIPARGKASLNAALTITAEQNGKAEDIIKYYNWIFSEEGTTLSSFGIEGVHYTMTDGKPIINEPYNKSFVEARGAGLNFTPLPHLFSSVAYEQILLSGKTYEECDESTKLFYDALHAAGDKYYTVPPVLSTKAFQQKQATIMPKLETMLAECVIGKITVDEFFAEYEKLKPIGLQEILDEGKAAWDKMK
ncbi:MAG: extracellular solute-binding protein, partial [Oscillospiraceae bacterium]